VTLDPKWKQTVENAISNKEWDKYDDIIKREVNEYNRRMARTKQFLTLDWSIFKAMLWVESGGPSNLAWTSRPMQIGNPRDKGYAVMRHGKEAANLIMSDKLKQDIKGNINQPELNIRVGIAYALTRLVKTEMQSVNDPKDTTVHEYTVMAGDSLDKIAHKVGSTLDSMKELNPTANVLHPNQKLQYRKATVQRVITGWSALNTTNLAAGYNVGDPSYKEKLDYAISLFPKLKR
jgi:LysM repeat protein